MQIKSLSFLETVRRDAMFQVSVNQVIPGKSSMMLHANKIPFSSMILLFHPAC